jgi:hypothetical protein
MDIHLKITGGILIFLSFIHLIFPKYFDWEKELSSLTLINKQLMYVHTFFVALVVFLMGLFCVFCSGDIINTRLGQMLALGMFVFWAVRLIFQFFVYSPKLWKGKLFETTVHVSFSILWSYFSTIFFMIWQNGK